MSYTQNFDGVTAPSVAISGWAFDSGYTTVSSLLGGLSAQSSPNVLSTGSTTAFLFATYQTADTNGGNVVVSAKVAFTSAGSHKGRGAVLARGSSTTLDLTTTTWMAGYLDLHLGQVAIQKSVSGTQSNVASVTTGDLVADAWYQVTLTCTGTSFTLAIQRLSDGFWLNSSGTFQSGSATAVSGTDSSVSGAGYSGLYGAVDGGGTTYTDDFSLDVATITTVYFADSAAGGALSLGSGLAADSPGGSDGSLASRVDAGNASLADLSLASMAWSDSGSSSASSLQTIPTSVTATAADGGSGLDASLAVWLIADATAESESFLETFVLVDEDIAAASSFGLSLSLAGESSSLLDPIFVTQTAPAPTAWAADSAASFAATLASSFAGTTGAAGSLDSAAGIEAWSIATTLVGSDSASARLDSAAASEAWRSFSVVTYAGYHVYENTGIGDPINYASPVAEIVGLTTVTWTSPRLSAGTWSFGVRAFNPNGEERNVDVAATIVISAAGSDVSNIPDPPRALAAIAQGGGVIAVHWMYPVVSGPAAPTGFHVYKGTGGVVDYSTPAATATAGTLGLIGRYTATVSGLADRVAYTFGVRAFNGTGEETNTQTATATARATGPGAVQSLTITAAT